MTKLWGTYFLVALGLLGLLTWTNVEAHRKDYQQRDYQSPPRPSAPLNCDVDLDQRVPCGSPDISSDKCLEIGCCWNGGQCYFGKTVTVHCTSDGYFIVVVARCDTQPPIEIGSLSLLSEGDACGEVATNSIFSVFQFSVSECGTLTSDDQGAIVYENMLTSMYTTQSGTGSLITRDSHYQVTFQCIYRNTDTAYVKMELGLQDPPLSIYEQGPINVELKLANGQCYEKGCTDESYYSSFHMEGEYPIKKVLRDPVFVQVEVLNRNDPYASLLLHRCWATKDAYPHSFPQWDILINGCPNSADSQNIRLIPNDMNSYQHYKRFMFRMFAFLTQSDQKTTTTQQVYIHCSTSICLMDSGNVCQQPCLMSDHKTKRAIANEERKTVATLRGLVYEDFVLE